MLTPTSPDLSVQMVSCYDVWISRIRERKRVPLTTNEIAHRTTTSADGRASRWVGETEGWEKQAYERKQLANVAECICIHLCSQTFLHICYLLCSNANATSSALRSLTAFAKLNTLLLMLAQTDSRTLSKQTSAPF